MRTELNKRASAADIIRREIGGKLRRMPQPTKAYNEDYKREVHRRVRGIPTWAERNASERKEMLTNPRYRTDLNNIISANRILEFMPELRDKLMYRHAAVPGELNIFKTYNTQQDINYVRERARYILGKHPALQIGKPKNQFEPPIYKITESMAEKYRLPTPFKTRMSRYEDTTSFVNPRSLFGVDVLETPQESAFRHDMAYPARDTARGNSYFVTPEYAFKLRIRQIEKRIVDRLAAEKAARSKPDSYLSVALSQQEKEALERANEKWREDHERAVARYEEERRAEDLKNALIVGGVSGAATGGVAGALISPKNRIRNALIGAGVGAAAGVGGGWLYDYLQK